MNSPEKAKYIIDHNNFMVIATSDMTGKPWVSPVGFAYDEDFNFYWVSSKEALHSKNINQREEIAISIFGPMPDGSFDGVYVDARAFELTDVTDIEKGIKLFATQRPQPAHFVTHSANDVTSHAIWRMYKASPVEVYKRTDDTANGQAITVRERVQLK